MATAFERIRSIKSERRSMLTSRSFMGLGAEAGSGPRIKRLFTAGTINSRGSIGRRRRANHWIEGGGGRREPTKEEGGKGGEITPTNSYWGKKE